MAAVASPDALERSLPLLIPAARPGEAERRAARPRGWLDLLGAGAGPARTGRAQELMHSGVVPAIYEKLWRPALGRVAKGLLGPSMADEHRIARLLLGLTPGDGVLDLACGPGNFTRDFARVVGPAGLVVGLDGSETMLDRAARDTPPEDFDNVAYLRADAQRLPFRDSAFDGVCCFAALHMFGDPLGALEEMARVLTPGGRIALLTSCRTRTPALRAWDGLMGAQSGQRMFERDEVTGALGRLGFEDVTQRVAGLTQFVGGRLSGG